VAGCPASSFPPALIGSSLIKSSIRARSGDYPLSLSITQGSLLSQTGSIIDPVRPRAEPPPSRERKERRKGLEGLGGDLAVNRSDMRSTSAPSWSLELHSFMKKHGGAE
jgi:hypothetical protein